MPSSVIIVALAAAWLVVLVPMVARRRQQVARTDGTALAARVVRSGGGREEIVVSDNRGPSVEDDLEDVEDVQVIAPVRREVVERRPAPAPRVRRNAVVVDLDDEDPAFHELDEPGEGPYRRAVGE